MNMTPTKHVAKLYRADEVVVGEWDVMEDGLLIDSDRRYVSFYTTKDRRVRLMLSDSDRFTVEEVADVNAIRQARQSS